jgi:predicted GIY-YIG superfamily endonuclease
MCYVYLLQSKKDSSKYIGVTKNLKRRSFEHNNENSKYSKSKMPFKLIWYSAFTEKEKAYPFEKYLKSSSGYAFTAKRLI